MKKKTFGTIRYAACHSLLLAMVVSTALRAEDNPDATEGERKLIEQCVAEITGLGAEGVIQDGTGIAMAFGRLQELGPDAKAAIPVLTRALRYDSDYARIQSAYTLWKIDGRADAIPLLGEALKDERLNERDRAMAAEMLGQIGPEAKAAIPVLTDAIKDPSAGVRVNAAYALWTVGGKAELVKPVLTDALKDEDPNVKADAAKVLEMIDAQASGEKSPTAETPDPETVAKAFIAALVEKDAGKAAGFVIEDQREEFSKALAKGIPPLPSDPKLQTRLEKDGIRAGVKVLNGDGSESKPPFGFNLKLVEGKWWIVR